MAQTQQSVAVIYVWKRNPHLTFHIAIKGFLAFSTFRKALFPEKGKKHTIFRDSVWILMVVCQEHMAVTPPIQPQSSWQHTRTLWCSITPHGTVCVCLKGGYTLYCTAGWKYPLAYLESADTNHPARENDHEIQLELRLSELCSVHVFNTTGQFIKDMPCLYTSMWHHNQVSVVFTVAIDMHEFPNDAWSDDQSFVGTFLMNKDKFEQPNQHQ